MELKTVCELRARARRENKKIAINNQKFTCILSHGKHLGSTAKEQVITVRFVFVSSESRFD